MSLPAGSSDASFRPCPERLAPHPRIGDYPHVARCGDCQDYLEQVPTGLAAATIVSAVLTYHDTGHRLDPLAGSHHQVSWI
jgi:hypothetical protein